jgi:hypothetical protein
MNFRMTLGALCQKSLFHRIFCGRGRATLRIERRTECPLNAHQLRMEVHRVASQAEERLTLNKQIVCDGTVRVMANAAILVHGLVFKNERSLF